MHRIIERRDGDRTLYILDDGYDYAGLLGAFRAGEIVGTPLSGGTPERRATRIEHDGRLFVLKTDTRHYRHWDARLKLRLYGPPFLPVMRKVVKAVDGGFDRIQRMYLIEQTVTRDPRSGDVAVTVWLLLEFLPGEPLTKRRECLQQAPELFRELFRHRLAQSDPSFNNFIVADGALKVIDLHFFSNPFLFVWPRGVLKVEEYWGMEFPLDSRFDRAVLWTVRNKLRLLRFLHRLGRKKAR